MKDLSFITKLKIPFDIKIPGILTKQQINIGVDIGNFSIKLVAVETKGKEKILRRISLSPVGSQIDLARTLSSFVKSQAMPGHNVNVSLSGPAVIMRYITFPIMDVNELRSTMQYEAKEYMPFPLEDVILDCAVLKEKTPDNKMLVLLAAVKKTAVFERINLLEKAGLTPSIIDIDCLCLVNAFNNAYSLVLADQKKTGKSETIGLLNIGNKFTNMAIIEDGILRFSRDIAFGGNDITKKIADIEQVDYVQAEAIKTDFQKTQELLPKIESVINNLSSEIRLSIDYYENQSGHAIDKIFLSGGSSYLLSIADFFNHLFGMPVLHLDVFNMLGFDALLNQDELKPKSNCFAIALGLALRE